MNPYLINNPLTGVQSSLGLTQLAGFTPVKEFTDAVGIKWHLVKSAFDSSVSIPDPSLLVPTDAWYHRFPGTKEDIFCYCVEGVKRPRAETERPVAVLYSWFSTREYPAFTPQCITQAEWLRANVYASQITDARMSKLNALCGFAGQAQVAPMSDLIQMPKVDVEDVNPHF